jgi:hypothetical protein
MSIGKKSANRKETSGKTISEKGRISRGKRAYPLPSLAKTLEISLVMFWKKSRTPENAEKTDLFRYASFFNRKKIRTNR